MSYSVCCHSTVSKTPMAVPLYPSAVCPASPSNTWAWDRIASCILGMSDIILLVKKGPMDVSDVDVTKMQEKMSKVEFDFDDFFYTIENGLEGGRHGQRGEYVTVGQHD